MKFKILVSMIALIVASFAHANDDLKAIMKGMGKDFKSLGAQINDSSKNASSIQLAQDISNQLKKTNDMVPDEVANLPADQQAAALTEYKTTNKKVNDEVDQAIAALQANDNATAASILSQVANDKKSAHDKFNPQP